MEKTLFDREILHLLQKWLKRPEIIILNGPRRVGKTSLLRLIEKHVKSSKKYQHGNIVFLNLENIDLISDLNEHPDNVFRYLKDKKTPGFLLLDEIQNLEKPSRFLKYLYDEYEGQLKIAATGSSSLDLKANLQDSLAGRKINFNVTPLSFREFLNFKGIKINEGELTRTEERDYYQLLKEYLLYGGLPAVVLTPDCKIKEKLLREYVNTYITKDVRAITRIKSVENFNKLIKLTAASIGCLLNVNEIANTADLPRFEAEKYLEIAHLTYVLAKVRPYEVNLRRRIVKMPKIYFFDLGVRNTLINNFTDVELRPDNGFLFENFIYHELRNLFDEEIIFFFRTLSKSEIDFVIDEEKVLLVEVKFKKDRRKFSQRIFTALENKIKGKKVNNFLIYLGPNEKFKDFQLINFSKVKELAAKKNI